MVHVDSKNPAKPDARSISPSDEVRLRFLSALIDNVPDNIYFKDCDGRFLLVNMAMARYFGRNSPKGMEGLTDFDLFAEEHALAARKDELEVMSTGKPVIGKEEKETWPNGTGATWVSTTKMPLYDEAGKLLGTFGISRDITARKVVEESLRAREDELRAHRDHLEELIAERTSELQRMNAQLLEEISERRRVELALRESEDRYRRLLQGLPTYVYSVTVEHGRPVATHHGAGCVEVTGYTPEDYASNTGLWLSMVHPDDREMVRNFAARGFGSQGKSIEHRIIHKGGQLRWVRNTIVHHYNQAGELTRYDGLVEDITDRKRMEEARREGEKTRAVSDLASGVGHSFNTLVSAIMGSAASIADNLLPNTRCHDDALRIIEAARHAGELTTRLLSVARSMDQGADGGIEAVSLRKIVEEAVGLLQRPFAEKGVVIKVRDAERLPWVKANASQLLDALVSMFVNAAEAMPDGGTISVWVTKRKLAQPAPRWNPNAEAGTYALVRVTDTGVGMDREVQDRIFEPFFSTRNSKSAFGLALSMAQQMVKRWGGWIGVRSKVGVGTTMRMFIPMAEGPSSDGAAVPLFKGGTVLVVDDDRGLLKVMREALEAAGFKVLTADTAADGVALYRRYTKKVDVSIVDMVIPGADWKFVLEAILSHEAQANVIVTSGFSRDYVRGQLNLGAWRFLQKPFDAEQLVGAVTNALARASS